ncbi:hypothetical protein [Cohnella sp. 56]|uniref:hypothetical protein n=1 Tax=Cohnella sp. 56 TaxID=3113722 RepID=UPI0030E7A465
MDSRQLNSLIGQISKVLIAIELDLRPSILIDNEKLNDLQEKLNRIIPHLINHQIPKKLLYELNYCYLSLITEINYADDLTNTPLRGAIAKYEQIVFDFLNSGIAIHSKLPGNEKDIDSTICIIEENVRHETTVSQQNAYKLFKLQCDYVRNNWSAENKSTWLANFERIYYQVENVYK